MTRPLRWAWALLAALVLCCPPAGQVLAQDYGEEAEGLTASEAARKVRERPLDVVQSKFFVKRRRLEVFPHFYADVLNNSYAHRFLVVSGAGISYHFAEALFLEAVVDFFPHYGFDTLKSLTRALAYYVDKGDYVIPDVPKEYMAAGLALGFSPIYGKINFVGTYVQNFDISFVLGPGLLVLHRDRYRLEEYDAQGAPVLVGPLEREVKRFAGVNVGLTTRFFLTRWLTLRVDARIYSYPETVVDYTELLVLNSLYAEVPYTPTKVVVRGSFVLAAGLSGFLPFQR